MNTTPRSNRLHIALFGRRNVGKSSLLNALTGQQVAVVSPVAGTTTDPVYKSMEVPPLGPVVFIDTPGLDDEGDLGRLRIQKAQEVLRKTDLALLVVTSGAPWGRLEEELAAEFGKHGLPYLVVVNMSDRLGERAEKAEQTLSQIPAQAPAVKVSAVTGEGIGELIQRLCRLGKAEDGRLHLIDGLVNPGDLVLLVTPIDREAPKGRLILPQQQVLRDLLDNGALALVVKETEVEEAFRKLAVWPALVITDSRVFAQVNAAVPEEVPLTSFSLLFARQKGDLALFVQAIEAVKNLQDGDRILVAEACTHHRQDDDIGTVVIPNLLRQKTGKKLRFDHVSGGDFSGDLSVYKLVIHCGACMFNKKEMAYRQQLAAGKGVPMVNYGVLLAYLHGILARAIAPLQKELTGKRG